MYCPYCGKENSDQAKYCSSCGKKLVVNETQSSTTDSSMPPEPPISSDNGKDKKKPKKWIIPVAIALVAVVVIILIVVSRMASDSGTDEAVVWQSGDNMQIMDAGFTDRQITEEESAILAAQDVSDAMGYENAFDDLTPYLSTTTNGGCFYRLQETYQGIPVYQRYVIVVASEEGNAQGLYTDAVDIPEDLSLTPTLTDEEARDAVVAYTQSQGEEVSEDLSVSKLSDDALVIYIHNESESACLAYEVTVENNGCYLVILDAQTGEVLERVSTVDDIADTGTYVIGNVSFPVDYDKKTDTYTMCDPEREIYIHNLNKKNARNTYGGLANWNLNKASDVTSKGDSVFGNTEEEEENDTDIAANLMTNVYEIASWYESLGQKFPLENLKKIDVYYNGSLYEEKNGEQQETGAGAFGALNPVSAFDADKGGTGVLVMGYDFNGTEKDTIAHEFTHIIAREYDVTTGDKSDPGIGEGLADTFACFFTGHWDIDATKANGGHRNAENPARFNFPVTIDDPNETGKDDDHAYATVISHAAYLMYDSEVFSMEELTDLWYQTMLLLPSNCTYMNLATTMYRFAGNEGKYSTDQIMTIVRAFAEVGIFSYQYTNNEIELDVWNKQGKYYDDYTVEIIDLNAEWEKDDNGKLEEPDYLESDSVNTAKPYELELPDGIYQIKVTDNAIYIDKTEKFYFVFVSGDYDKGRLSFDDFGAEYIAAPGATIMVEDADGNKVNFAGARAVYFEADEDGNLQQCGGDENLGEVLDVPEFNYYSLWIQISDDSDDTSSENNTYTFSHTVQVKEGGEDTIIFVLPDEEDAGLKLTDDMYSELLEGNLTKEQFEVALAYAPAEVEDGEIDRDDLLTMIDEICYDYDYPDLCFGGYLRDPSDQDYDRGHYISSLDVVNNFLSVLTDTPLSENDAQGWESNLIINGDTVDVKLYDRDWNTLHANITDAVLQDEMMTIVYEVRSTGSVDYNPDGTGTRTALLTQTEEGSYRVNRIFQGTPEEIYHNDRQVIRTVDQGDWIEEEVYYDLISLEETDAAHQAINDGLTADYQAFLDYMVRMTGESISEIQSSDNNLYHSVGAGVTNIQDGVFSARLKHWTLEGAYSQVRQYGLTYSLETGEQLSIRDLTDLSDEELLSQIQTALRDYLNESYLMTDSRENSISSYTLDDITSGINFLDSGRLSFCVQDDEIYILIPPQELFEDIYPNDGVPTGIYISVEEE